MSSQAHLQIRLTVGGNLHAARKKRRLTLREVGNLVGVSEAQMWRWEKGKHLPVDRTLDALAEALGVEYDDFFAEPERKAAA